MCQSIFKSRWPGQLYSNSRSQIAFHQQCLHPDVKKWGEYQWGGLEGNYSTVHMGYVSAISILYSAKWVRIERTICRSMFEYVYFPRTVESQQPIKHMNLLVWHAHRTQSSPSFKAATALNTCVFPQGCRESTTNKTHDVSWVARWPETNRRLRSNLGSEEPPRQLLVASPS